MRLFSFPAIIDSTTMRKQPQNCHPERSTPGPHERVLVRGVSGAKDLLLFFTQHQSANICVPILESFFDSRVGKHELQRTALQSALTPVPNPFRFFQRKGWETPNPNPTSMLVQQGNGCWLSRNRGAPSLNRSLIQGWESTNLSKPRSHSQLPPVPHPFRFFLRKGWETANLPRYIDKMGNDSA